jgi:acetyl-CoA C-acetyltransferase
VTPANSSSISDGAAALVLASARCGRGARAQYPRAYPGPRQPRAGAGPVPTAPVPAAQKLLDRIGWSKSDVDLWEVNEAFAVVPMAFMHEMGVPRETS